MFVLGHVSLQILIGGTEPWAQRRSVDASAYQTASVHRHSSMQRKCRQGAPAVDVRDRKKIVGLNAVTYRKLVKRVPAEVMSVTSSALHSRSPTAAARGQICTKQVLQWSHMRQAILQFAVQYLWYNVSCIGKLRPHCRLAANDQCFLRGTE